MRTSMTLLIAVALALVVVSCTKKLDEESEWFVLADLQIHAKAVINGPATYEQKWLVCQKVIDSIDTFMKDHPHGKHFNEALLACLEWKLTIASLKEYNGRLLQYGMK
ncbi:MAG TPA: hypothetical protein VMS71_00345 [Candidatus Acidoferrum sp.]|nr:hypothetical protein [Candidatus Acidoferrum sp.]